MNPLTAPFWPLAQQLCLAKLQRKWVRKVFYDECLGEDECCLRDAALIQGAEQHCFFCLRGWFLVAPVPARSSTWMLLKQKGGFCMNWNNLFVVDGITEFTFAVNFFLMWSLFLPHTWTILLDDTSQTQPLY